MTSAIAYTWQGDGFTPLPRFAKECDRRFVVGENYRLELVEDRSAATHRHFFALINEAWLNLPEAIAERFPTADHLRKWALIKKGYREERTIVASSKAEARKIAAFSRGIDDFAVVVVHGNVVSHYTAKSQSMREMGKRDFQKSKQDVLDAISEMLGVALQELSDQVRGKAATMRRAKEVA